MVPDMITLAGEYEEVIESIVHGIAVFMVDNMGGLEVKEFGDEGPGQAL
jgi:hypothetical protein